MKSIRGRLSGAIQKLEIRFWDAFIPLMRKSATMRFLVPRLYRLFQMKEFYKLAGLMLVLTILGLITGFLIGALS